MFSAPHSSVSHKTHDTIVIDSIITDIVMKMNVEVNSSSSVSAVDRRQEVVRCSCQENGTCLTALCAKCKVSWRGDYGVGLFFRGCHWPLSSSERNSKCFSMPIHYGQFHTPNFVGTV